MNNETIACEINRIRSFKYERLCKYLKEKYGEVNGPYFINENCKTKNEKIKRTNEGLFIHHIYESKVVMLSHSEYAVQFPFEWQQGQNLVYCNYFEHVLLHIAIVKEYLKVESKKTKMAVGLGGLLNYMIPEIIDYINGYEYSRAYMRKALSVIDGNELLFIDILDNLRSYISSDYEIFYIMYSILEGPNKTRAMLNAYRCGKMIKQGRFDDLLLEYDVIKQRIKKIDTLGFVSLVEQSLTKPGYNYAFDYIPRGKYCYVCFRYTNKSDNVVRKEYAVPFDDLVDIKEIEEKYFKKLFYYDDRCMLIKKNSIVSYKEIKNTKNVNKRYCLTIDGMAFPYAKYTKDQVMAIVDKSKHASI